MLKKIKNFLTDLFKSSKQDIPVVEEKTATNSVLEESPAPKKKKRVASKKKIVKK